jgi:hypothetical protein
MVDLPLVSLSTGLPGPDVAAGLIERRAFPRPRQPVGLPERIGWGGSATVYRADDLALEGRIALKALHPALADDCAVTERFDARQAARGR